MKGSFGNGVNRSQIINGLILSAGLSSRMGELKPLLLYNGTPFITTILNKLNIVCDAIGIVAGHEKNRIQDIIHRDKPDTKTVKLIFNENFKEGMFSSLQTGLKEMSDCDWLLYHFVDQPHIPEKFYKGFILELEESYNWIQPKYDGRKGHPIILHHSLFSMILESEHTSLKEISNSPKIKKKFWDCSYPQILDDIDTKEDYQKLI